MDRSLWLLLGLRIRGWFRRRGRDVRTLKGFVLAILGSLIFLPMLSLAFFGPRIMIATQLDLVRRFGPLVLLAYCVLNVVVSSGDRSVYYAPAEIDFLFSGPYRPRQLLIYKVVGGVGAALVTALMMAFAFSHHTAMFGAAFVGLFLSLVLIYLFALTLGLAASTFGALAYSRGRQVVLVALGLVAFGAVWPLGKAALSLPFWEVANRLLRSPNLAVVLTPFRPFVMTFTAERVWPELVTWSALAALVDLGLLLVVLTLHARFLEAAAVASVRVHERLQRARRGEFWAGEAKAHFSIPMLPWWGGVGPNLWRQLTSASRAPILMVTWLIVFLMPPVLNVMRHNPVKEEGMGPTMTVLLVLALFAQSTVGYDFRADHLRMESLKSLPVRSTRLVLGQLLTPVLMLSGAECVSLAAIALVDPTSATVAAVGAAIVLPMNLVLVAVGNLYFLCFPYRSVGVSSLDILAVGRQMLLMMTEAASVVGAGGLGAGVGALVYWFAGESLVAAVASAAGVVGACGLALVPLVAWAFDRFDVARDGAE